jgi:tetratricopeptide (TPR) repeat protein
VAEGTQALQARKISDSSDLFQRAIKADPTYFDAYYYFGAVAREAGNVSASVEALEKALLLRPESAEARYGFAWALQQAHFPQDCANELEKLLKLTPNDTRAHLFLANVYAQELSQAKLARVHYTQVLSAEPNHPQAAAIRHWLGANP